MWGIGILAVEVRHIICFSLDIFSRIIHRSQIADYELRTGGEMIGIIVNVYAPVFLFVSSKAIPTVAESEQHIRHIVDGCIVSASISPTSKMHWESHNTLFARPTVTTDTTNDAETEILSNTITGS